MVSMVRGLEIFVLARKIMATVNINVENTSAGSIRGFETVFLDKKIPRRIIGGEHIQNAEKAGMLSRTVTSNIGTEINTKPTIKDAGNHAIMVAK